MTAHRYWRLYITANNGESGFSGLGEIELRESIGGSDVTGSGTAISSGDLSGSYAAAYAFSDDYHEWLSTAATSVWIGYDFGSGVTKDIVQIVLFSGTYATACPRDFKVEYSDDGAAWTELLSIAGQIYWPGATVGREYTLVGTLQVSKVVAYALFGPQPEESASASTSDTLASIRDSLSWSIQRTRFATVADSLRSISDLLFPPPLQAHHFDGNISDTLGLVEDDATAVRSRSFIASIFESLLPVRDSIAAGMINLEKPARWVAPVSITPRVDSIDPIHLAAHAIRHPGKYFEPRVKSYGIFTRAISAPAGFIKTGDANLSLLDPDNSVRRRIATKTIRKADTEIRLGPEGGKLSSFLRPFRRSVGTISQPADGELSVNLQDLCFDFLERKLPSLINATNFAHLPDGTKEGFAPLVVGSVSSPGGAIACPYVDTVKFGYIANLHPSKAVTAVYRKAEDSDEFVIVSASEYTVTMDTFLDHGEGGGDYCTLVEFTAEQKGDIRADVDGIVESDGVTLRCTNFADFLLELFEYVTWLTERTDSLNLTSFEETKIATADLLCAGAITEPITYAEIVSRIQRSSNIDVFADKNDRISVHYTADDEVPTVNLDDLLRLYKGTVRQQLADPAHNRIPYRYAPNYASGEWTENAWDNEADQEALGEVTDEEPLQMYFVRDVATALSVVERRGQYLDLDSFRFEAEIPLIPVLEQLELANLVGVTHFGGIKAGGYVGEQFKILELGMDVDNLKYLVKGIRRRMPPPSKIVSTGIAGGLHVNSRCGPYYLGVEGELWGCFSYLETMRIWRTTDWGVTWAVADEANQPGGFTHLQSFDSCVNGNLIHVATQDSDGIVEYHLFDTSTAKWITVREALTSVIENGGGHCVSVECRYPGNEPLVYYQGTRELQAGQLVGRGYYRILLDGEWTAPSLATAVPPPIEMANSIGCTVQRVIPGRDNRMHFMYAVGDGVVYREFACTLLGNLTLGEAVRLWTTTWVFYPAGHNTGGWAISEDRSRIYRLWKGSFGCGHIDRINEGEVLSRIAWSDWITPWVRGGIVSSNEAAAYPQGFLAIDGSDLYFVHASVGPNYVGYHKSTDEGAWIPADPTDPIKAGPAFVGAWNIINECFGNMYKVRGKLYMTYFYGPNYPTFGWVQVDKLPYVD